MYDPRILWSFEGDLPALPPSLPSPALAMTLARRTDDGGALTYLRNGNNECFKVAAWGILALIPGFVDQFVTRVRSKQKPLHPPFFILNTYLAFVRMASEERGQPFPGMADGEFGTLHFLKTGVRVAALFLDLAPSWYVLIDRMETQERRGGCGATIVETEGVTLNAANVRTTCNALMVREGGNHFVLYARQGGVWRKFDSLASSPTAPAFPDSAATIVAALLLGDVAVETIAALRAS